MSNLPRIVSHDEPVVIESTERREFRDLYVKSIVVREMENGRPSIDIVTVKYNYDTGDRLEGSECRYRIGDLLGYAKASPTVGAAIAALIVDVPNMIDYIDRLSLVPDPDVSVEQK